VKRLLLRLSFIKCAGKTSGIFPQYDDRRVVLPARPSMRELCLFFVNMDIVVHKQGNILFLFNIFIKIILFDNENVYRSMQTE
jgi:hypothetical protein